MRKWLPPKSYTAIKAGKLYLSKWDFNDGSMFDIMTYDMDPKQFEGPTLNFIWFDEPPPLQIWAPNIRGLRAGGTVIMTMTPLSDADWIFERLENPDDYKDWALTVADAEDNCKEHGVRGTLLHKNIERVIDNYPDEEREARKTGKPIALRGKIFTSFKRDKHVISSLPKSLFENEKGEPAKNYTLYHSCDPHDRKPFALGWYIVDKYGFRYCIDEWPNEYFHKMKSCSLTIPDYVEIIKEKEEKWGQPFIRIIDARYGNRRQITSEGDTIRDLFDDNGIHYQNSCTEDCGSIASGHNMIKGWLKHAEGMDPGFFILEKCINHTYSFAHYSHENKKRGYDKAPTEKVSDKYKDFIDLTRYFAMEKPKYIDKPQDNGYNSIPDTWDSVRGQNNLEGDAPNEGDLHG